MFRIFPKLNVINIIGFINYLGKSSKKLNIPKLIKSTNFSRLHLEKFDEILVSSFEHNFEIEKLLENTKHSYFSLYDNTSRSLLDIHEKKIIRNFKNYNKKKLNEIS